MTQKEHRFPGAEEAIATAIALVTEALERLDAVEAPADIGAHLDLALHRMKSTVTQ